MATTTMERENAFIDKVIGTFDTVDKAVERGEVDAQLAEQFDKERSALRAEALAIKEQWAEDAKSLAETAEEETFDAVYSITDKDKLENSVAKMNTGVRAFHNTVRSNLAAGVGVTVTTLPSVISPDPAPAGGGAIPEFHFNSEANNIPGAMLAGKGGLHLYAQPRLRVPEAKLDLFSEAEIGFASPAVKGERHEVAYRALPMDMNRLIATTQTGGPGAAQIAPGTNFEPVPQMLEAFTGPMTSPMLWNVKVTPSDLNEYKVLQFITESEAKNRGENVAKDVSDPTTAEIVIGAHKVATDLEFTTEALLTNYLVSFEEAFVDQGEHAHGTKVSNDLTTGSGVGVNPLGILTAADAITNVPTLTVANAALDAIAVNQVTYVQLKGLLKPGLRRAPLVAMFSDGLHFRALVSQLNATAPGFSLPLDVSDADDDMGFLGRMWGMLLQSNQAITEDPSAAGRTIGLIVAGKSWCTRTTGTSVSFNPYDEQARDVISVYIRTWVDGNFTKIQQPGNFSVGRLRTS